MLVFRSTYDANVETLFVPLSLNPQRVVRKEGEMCLYSASRGDSIIVERQNQRLVMDLHIL